MASHISVGIIHHRITITSIIHLAPLYFTYNTALHCSSPFQAPCFNTGLFVIKIAMARCSPTAVHNVDWLCEVYSKI